jgi:hypothetical protein
MNHTLGQMGPTGSAAPHPELFPHSFHSRAQRLRAAPRRARRRWNAGAAEPAALLTPHRQQAADKLLIWGGVL